MGLFAFLLVVQSLITFIHWIVFQSMRFYFGVHGALAYYFLWVCFLLSLTFLVSNIATRLFPSAVSRFAYRVATFWLGTLHFLFLATVAIALLQIASHFLVLPMPNFVAPIIFLLAIILSVHATLHAKKLHIVRHTISLPHLPSAWSGKKVAFFADTHFGNIHRKHAAERLAEQISCERPDLILMGGDFFDGPPIDADLVTKPFRFLTNRIPTFFVSGNHEEYGKKADFLRSLQEHGFRIINDQKVVLDGLQIVGLDFMTTRTEASTAMTLQHLAIDRSLPTIVLKHIPRHIETIESLGGHLLLSGHTHQGQLWPINFITHFIYHGFDYGLKTLGNLSVYTTSGAGSWGPPQRLGTQTELVIFTLENRTGHSA